MKGRTCYNDPGELFKLENYPGWKEATYPHFLVILMDDQASSIHTDGAAESTPKAKHQSDISHSTVIQPQAQVSAPPISSLRKALLLLLFSLAQFIDTCNVAEMISALPTVSSALKFQSDESVWLVSTYQLTFSSFLLMVSL